LDALDGRGQTCLAKCAMRGYEKACLKLVAMGANPNGQSAQGEGALALAAVCGHLGTFKALLGAGADAAELDSDGNGIVHKIVDGESGDAKAMLLLAVENGELPHLANKRGLTALKMMQNVGVRERDPRYEVYRHLEALAEGRAIGLAAGPTPLALDGGKAARRL
jgi:ankyrin repeat protein